MLKMFLRDFKAKYGEHRAIAALAVIVEDESVGKKRMIHDATIGVRVNHRIYDAGIRYEHLELERRSNC